VSGKTKRKASQSAEETHDSAAREREAEESAEKKVIYVWQAMEQIFGTRWNDKFGNDPLGKYKDAEGRPNPRMELWIDLCKYASWPQIKSAVQRVRDMPKPTNDAWWLPDLQVFSACVRAVHAVQQSEAKRPIPTWPELACNRLLLRLIFQHGPFSAESMGRLQEVLTRVKGQMRYLLEEGELPKEPEEKDYREVQDTLMRQFQQLKIDPASDEEKVEMQERFRVSRGL
jgi:hypothetical protein